jgi:hypothetical protein
VEFKIWGLARVDLGLRLGLWEVGGGCTISCWLCRLLRLREVNLRFACRGRGGCGCGCHVYGSTVCVRFFDRWRCRFKDSTMPRSLLGLCYVGVGRG